MPGFRIHEITTIGVSIDSVVATMDVPKSHQGRLRSETKYDLILFEAWLER